MFRLYGKKSRCVWCGKTIEKDFIEVLMTNKYAKPPQETAIVCSEKHEKKLLSTLKLIEKNFLVYITVFILGIIASVAGILLIKDIILGLGFLGIGLIILGVINIILPFVTPQTVKILGLQKGMISGRIGGFLLFFMGLLIFIG